jgi:hypothetical protein
MRAHVLRAPGWQERGWRTTLGGDILGGDMTSRPIAALLAKRRPQVFAEATDEAPEGEVAILEERLEFGLGAFAGLRHSSEESEHFERASSSMEERIDLRRFGSAEDLLSTVGADALKAELARLGLKCGGAPPQRAERLWQTKGVALSDLQQAQLGPQ